MPGTVRLVHWLFSQFLDMPAFLELTVSWGNESTKNLYDIFQVVISVVKIKRSKSLQGRLRGKENLFQVLVGMRGKQAE